MDRDVSLIVGSYFSVPFGVDAFDTAASVESLHHFTKEEKIPLYAKLCRALKENGYFILTDYFSPSDEAEREYRNEYLARKAQQGILDDALYHYDTPLTVEHEREALLQAGFTTVEVLRRWGQTYCLRAAARGSWEMKAALIGGKEETRMIDDGRFYLDRQGLEGVGLLLRGRSVVWTGTSVHREPEAYRASDVLEPLRREGFFLFFGRKGRGTSPTPFPPSCSSAMTAGAGISPRPKGRSSPFKMTRCCCTYPRSCSPTASEGGAPG